MKLQTPRGTRDFLPEEMAKRQYVFNTIRNIFEKYGYEELQTPAIEYEDTLKGKYGEEEKLIWKFEDLGGRKVALKFDLTVPLARVMAMSPNINKPFKRYQIQPAYRCEKPQRGRYREFYQCDIDIIGTAGMAADAEIITIMVDIMDALNFEEYVVRINNRKLLDAIIERAGVPANKVIEAFRAIDKLDKLGIDGVRGELKNRGIEKKAADKIIEVIEISGAAADVLKKIERMVPKESEGIKELRELFLYLDQFGVNLKRCKLDLSLVRGLDYYTGPVYETVVTKPKIGSLTGGGRWDKLIGKYSGRDMPATGTTIGVERIIDAMSELGLFGKIEKTKVRVFVAAVSDDVRSDAIKMAQKLRAADIATDFDLMNRSLRKQFEYVNAKKIPLCAVVGPAELKEKSVVLRDMKSGREEKVKIADLVKRLI